MIYVCVPWPQNVNTWRPRQNGRHLPDDLAKFMGPTWSPPGSCRPQMGPMLDPWTLLSGDIFKKNFLNENVWFFIKISLKSVSEGPINNIPASVQMMAWHRPGDEQLSEPMMVRLPTHMCVTRPQSINVETHKLTRSSPLGRFTYQIRNLALHWK